VRRVTASPPDMPQESGMFFRKPSLPPSTRRIWIEELLGADLPRSAAQREALIGQLLARGGDDTFAAMRAGLR